MFKIQMFPEVKKPFSAKAIGESQTFKTSKEALDWARANGGKFWKELKFAKEVNAFVCTGKTSVF